MAEGGVGFGDVVVHVDARGVEVDVQFDHPSVNCMIATPVNAFVQE